ncbi:hypothetical protein MP638_002540 [Amoeboaphelidium occidentale]|nr:hypothetical protein MP638_002540 [Amoeboaphelidium occidentale]
MDSLLCSSDGKENSNELSGNAAGALEYKTDLKAEELPDVVNEDSIDQAQAEAKSEELRLENEYDNVLKQKKRLSGELLSLKEKIQQGKEELSAEDEQKLKSQLSILELRIHQLDTLENLFKSSYDALKLIVSFNISELHSHSEGLEKVFDEIKKENEIILSNSLDQAYKAKQEVQASEEMLQKIKNAQGSVSSGSNGSNETESREQNIAKDIVGGLLNNLDDAVDQLEGQMQDKDIEEEKKKGKIEAVVKIDENEEEASPPPPPPPVQPDEKHKNEDDHYMDDPVDEYNAVVRPKLNKDLLEAINSSSKVPPTPKDHAKAKHALQAPKLIDSENNVYVLSRSNDYTKYVEDTGFFNDFILLLTTGFVFGFLFDKIQLPAFFGYIMAGTVLGPSYYDSVERIVQVETLGVFGILFTLFVLGLEFPVEQVKKFWKTSVFGGSGISIVCILLITFIGNVFEFGLNQSLFLGSVVSLSSTSVVVKCVENDKESKTSRAAMSILVQQDILVGLFLAILPALAASDHTINSMLSSMASVVFSNLVFMALTLLFGRYAMPYILKILKLSKSTDLLVLGVFAVCFAFILVAEHFGISVEVAAFMAGVVIGGKQLHMEPRAHLMAVRDVFACLFFAAIGFHIYPSFLLGQAPLLLALTIGLMSFKAIVTFIVLRYGVRFTALNSAIVSLGLSQISEFAFVMCSRAKSLQIINRNVYYLLIGATSLSLVLTPFIWKFIWSCSGSKYQRHSRDSHDHDLPLVVPKSPPETFSTKLNSRSVGSSTAHEEFLRGRNMDASHVSLNFSDSSA